MFQLTLIVLICLVVLQLLGDMVAIKIELATRDDDKFRKPTDAEKRDVTRKWDKYVITRFMFWPLVGTYIVAFLVWAIIDLVA